MPIKPENRHLYPGDWPGIRARILRRSQNCCEFCGLRNGRYIVRVNGRVDDVTDHVERMKLAGKRAPFVISGPDYYWTATRVILTVAHMDHKLVDHSDENLKALCQKCHLDHDRIENMARAAEGRFRRKSRTMGQLILEVAA